jgi:hypothetical protein
MSAGEMGGVKFRGDGDQSIGERMMEVALGISRDVKDGLQRMEDRQVRMEDTLKDLAEQRREEAREAGEITTRIRTLETAMPWDARTRLENLEDSHRRVRSLVFTITGGLGLYLAYWLLRLAVTHPETLPR